LTEGLAAVAGQLEPAEATRVCAEAARSYLRALEQGPDDAARCLATERLATLVQPLDSETATRAVRVLVRRIVSDPNLANSPSSPGPPGDSTPRVFNPDVLDRFLTKRTRPEVQPRTAAIAAALGTSARGPAPGLPLLPAATEPLPCRLSTQDLVELLKMPTCVGPVRRVVLDQLGNRYGRRFDTHWDFVRYAQEQGLDLGFTTPPTRPERKLPPLFAA
jgi:hypothetical protein